MKIKVAAVQMVSGPDVDRNLEVADGLLAQAAKQGAKLDRKSTRLNSSHW